MAVLSTLLPVFLMIVLGCFVRWKGIITENQKAGISKLVFDLLMPVMVFNAVFTAELKSSYLLVIAYMLGVHALGLVVGKLAGKFTGRRYAYMSYYLMCTSEGGTVGFPLYMTLAGTAAISNIVMLDIASMFMAFLTIPVLVARQSSGRTDLKGLLRSVFNSPMVIALLLGLAFNLLGTYRWLQTTPALELYDGMISMITGPIVAMILICIGYDFRLEMGSFTSMLKMIFLRAALMAICAFGLLKLFPAFATDRAMLLAVLVYFSLPTGFLVPVLTAKLTREEDRGYMSAFISMYMIVTLIAFSVIAVTVG